jgi:hypothetical protein
MLAILRPDVIVRYMFLGSIQRRYAVYSTVAVILSFCAAAPPLASAGQITFDTVANGTIIDNVYPGVTFGCVTCASGHAYARDMNSFGSTTAASEPNVVTLVAPYNPNDPNSSTVTSFNTVYGAVTVFFATPQKTVSIDARPQLPLEYFGSGLNKPFLEAYSSTVQDASTFLGRVVYPLNFGSGGYCQPATGACGGPWQTLTFASSSDNIVSLRLSSQNSQGGPSVYGDFDNLTFQATPPPVVPTPEATFCANFDSGVPSGVTLFGSAVINGGYLKLTDNQQGRIGIAYLDDFNGGQHVTAFEATFKAALFGSTCCDGNPADGFSFNLVPAATAPAVPDVTYPMEEGLNQGLAVNFDTWDNGGGEAPAVEVKWLGQLIARVPFQASQSPSGATTATAASRDVIITLKPDGTVDVRYGGVLVLNNVQTPYSAATIGAPKWVIGARTGLATDNHWIDDLCISARSGAKLCADYSSVPAGTTLFGDAQVNGGILKLVTLPANQGYGIAYVDDFGGGDFVKAFRATFKAGLFGSTSGSPADGFSFNLVPASSALPNPGYNQPAEEGLDEGLAVTFDTWDNGGGEAPAIGIKWKGQFVTNVMFQASQSPAGAIDFNSAKRDVVIELKSNGRVDVSYGGALVLSNVATSYDPAAIGVPKWVLGARIGGANDNFWFDDLCLSTLPATNRAIPGLFNTGVDAAGHPLPDDAKDPHYKLIQGGTDAFVATSANGFPIPPWLGDNLASAWISPNTTTFAPSGGPAGSPYQYETTFDLSGFNPATARITGRWATDNEGFTILLNGLSISLDHNTAEFSAWTPFDITRGFLPGTNRLTFFVYNGRGGDPVSSDPTGVRVELWGSASLDCAAARPAPRINVTRQGSNIVVTWTGTGFILQSASKITGPWFDYTRGSSINGRDFTATIPSTGSNRFVRLRLDCP